MAHFMAPVASGVQADLSSMPCLVARMASLWSIAFLSYVLTSRILEKLSLNNYLN